MYPVKTNTQKHAHNIHTCTHTHTHTHTHTCIHTRTHTQILMSRYENPESFYTLKNLVIGMLDHKYQNFKNNASPSYCVYNNHFFYISREDPISHTIKQ